MSNRKKAGIPRVFEDAGITVRWDPYERAVLTGASSPFARDQGLALHYEAIPVLDDCHEVAPLVEAGEHLYAIISNTGDPSGFAVAEVLEEPVLAPAPEESDADAMRRRAAAVAQHATRASIKDPSIVLGGFESTAQGASREWRHGTMRTPNTRELGTSNIVLADSGVMIARMAYSPHERYFPSLGRDEAILRLLTGLPLVVSETFTKHDDVANHPPTVLPAHELAFSTDEARSKARAWNGWAQPGHSWYGRFCDQAGAAPFTLFEWASQGAHDAEEASALPAWFPPAVVHDWTALEAVCSRQAGELDDDSGMIPSGREARRAALGAMRSRALDIARVFNGEQPDAFLQFDENLAVMPEGEAPMWVAASRIDDEKDKDDTPRVRAQKRKMFADSVLEYATGAALAACEPGTWLRDSMGRPHRVRAEGGWYFVDFSNEKRRGTAMGFLSALRGLRFDCSGAAPSPTISILAGLLLGINRTVEDRGMRERGPFTGLGSTAVRAAGLALSALLWPVDGASKMRIGKHGIFGAIEDCSAHSAASLGFLRFLAASGSAATATRDDYERHLLAVKTAERLGSTSPEDVPFITPKDRGASHGAAFRNTTGAGMVAALAADSTIRILESLPHCEGENVLVRFLTESILLDPDCSDALVWRWNERIGVEAATRLLPKITAALQRAEEAVLEEARSQAAH